MTQRVLVTGCCGYLGAWIAVSLLRAGLRVRGTSQEPTYARVLFDEVFAAEEGGPAMAARLEIVQAELLDAGSWEGVATGCDAVVHTACPVRTEPGTPPEAMLHPALHGAEHVMREAARAGGVTRFVHLSSVVTLVDHHRPRPRGATAPERVGPSDWNLTASPATDPYAHAKVLGEQRLRALSGSLLPGAAFVSVLPGPVVGPPVGGARVAASIDKTIAPLLTGQLRAGSVDLWLGLVDVRDVATVCLRVLSTDLERLRALGDGGRFVCVAQPPLHLQELADAVRRAFPAYAPRLPSRRLPLPRWLLLGAMRWTVTPEAYSYTRAMLGRRIGYDTALTESVLGVSWRPPAASLVDTVTWLVARGHYPAGPP